MLREFIQLRDGTCRAPGCRRQATACDLDHALAHHRGGPTCDCNLHALCRHHHRLKQTRRGITTPTTTEYPVGYPALPPPF